MRAPPSRSAGCPRTAPPPATPPSASACPSSPPSGPPTTSPSTSTSAPPARRPSPKPNHLGDPEPRVTARARRQPAARPRISRAAGLTLAPHQPTATRNGRPLDLSVKEFGVLEALLRAAPAFLSAEDLLEQVWDEQADPFTNTVAVTMGRLRRKLGDPPVISTTPGVGYRVAC